MNAQPQFSPDGRWWWNGEAWVPAAPQRRQLTGPKVMWAVVGGLVIFAVLIVVIVGTIQEQQRREHFNDEYNRLTCQQYNMCGDSQ